MEDLKELARRIFHHTLAAIDIPATMQRKLVRTGTILSCDSLNIDLGDFQRVRAIAMGKAAHAMVAGLQSVLPYDLACEGVVSAPTRPDAAAKGMRYFLGGHPLPNAESFRAAEEMLAMLKECDARTLVFFLLSGGGSALVELPLDGGQSIEEVQQLYGVLVGCGASIDEINVVRKHLSSVKGGRLATAAPHAMKITLAVTDVPAGKESALASGPTLPDPTTIADFDRIMEKYELRGKFPAALEQWLDSRAMPETPKEKDQAFAKAHFSALLGMDDLFHPAHQAAEAAGCVTCCDNSTDDWPVERAAQYLLLQLEELRAANPRARVALIADGEVSSPVTGEGVGGRNAAFVLACVEKIEGRRIAVLSAGTDGIDGNSPAAGAVADGNTLRRAQEMGVDPTETFRRSDAYHFFAQLEDAIVTGPTGNNLRDLRIFIAEP